MNKRLLSIVLCVALLMSYLPAISFAAAADPVPTTMEPTAKVADPSTMDSWKELFLANKVNTENAGTVWTDKSVLWLSALISTSGIITNLVGADAHIRPRSM